MSSARITATELESFAKWAHWQTLNPEVPEDEAIQVRKLVLYLRDQAAELRAKEDLRHKVQEWIRRQTFIHESTKRALFSNLWNLD